MEGFLLQGTLSVDGVYDILLYSHITGKDVIQDKSHPEKRNQMLRACKDLRNLYTLASSANYDNQICQMYQQYQQPGYAPQQQQPQAQPQYGLQYSGYNQQPSSQQQVFRKKNTNDTEGGWAFRYSYFGLWQSGIFPIS
ncbi:hypothetical protein scyTo_0015187 [Scyliorhinus torazame]|uniref:Uncharacterized protein n=1 Tax=Scyliorhinus torazame TaxID=75743 RepID=A0A401P4I2_SCYTO|nr:hypothetical protein [Scyliorhinus torazame]